MSNKLIRLYAIDSDTGEVRQKDFVGEGVPKNIRSWVKNLVKRAYCDEFIIEYSFGLTYGDTKSSLNEIFGEDHGFHIDEGKFMKRFHNVDECIITLLALVTAA